MFVPDFDSILNLEGYQEPLFLRSGEFAPLASTIERSNPSKDGKSFRHTGSTENPFDTAPVPVNPFESAPAPAAPSGNPFDLQGAPKGNPFDTAPVPVNPFESAPAPALRLVIHLIYKKAPKRKSFDTAPVPVNPFESAPAPAAPSGNPFGQSLCSLLLHLQLPSGNPFELEAGKN